MPDHPILAIVVAAVAALAAPGCPTWSTDPDDDTTAADDDATGDDDASGDDDTAAGPGTVDVTGAPACSPVLSALWLDNLSHVSTLQGVHASTEALDCDTYHQWGAALAVAWEDFDVAYEAAWAERDPVAACVALRDYYQAIEGVEDQLWPPGSCALQLRLDGYVAGIYEVDGGLGGGLFGQLVYPTASYYGAALGSLGDCTQYTEWDGQWTVAQDAAADAAEATRTVWSLTDGGLTLTLEADGLRLATGVAIAIEDAAGTVGTLQFDLYAARCEL